MPYWLRHYTQFVDKIIVYDDNSDDGSKELMLDAGVEVRACPWSGIDDIIYPLFASNQYKEARQQADWVIWVDGDEFIYHPNIRSRLEQLTRSGVTVPHTQGYNMFSDGPPTGSGQIYDEIKNGVADHRYSKPVVINPDVDLVWEPGRHNAYFVSAKRDDDGKEPLKLLHYRWFGRDEFIHRNDQIWKNMTAQNRNAGLGSNSYPNSQAATHTLAWYEDLVAQAKPCV